MNGKDTTSLGNWVPIVGCMLVMTLVSGLSMSGLGVVAPEWMRSFSLSTGEVMVILTTISVSAGFFGIVVGMLVSRYTPTLLLLVGVVFSATALLLASRAQSFGLLMLAMVPLGAAANALTGPVLGQNLAVRNFARPGLAIAVVSMGMSFGAILGPPILAMLIQMDDWQGALATSSGVILVLGVALVLLTVRKVGPMVNEPTTAADITPVASASALRILISPAFVGAVLFQFPLTSLMAGTFFHLPLFFGELGGGLSDAAGMMSVAAFSGLAGTFLAGWLVDRMPLPVLQVAILVMMFGANMLVVSTPSFAVLGLAAVLFSIGNSVLFPLIPAILARRFSLREFPKAIGLFQPFLFSTIIGALVIGVVHDRYGTYPLTYQAILPMYGVVVLGMIMLGLKPRSGNTSADMRADTEKASGKA
ncbi:MFS transporter [Novosphingobium pentaromativorans]|uniref:MFS transporter n=2 Tax=Novosphingobium pentaromativorans TaxID=205844 RepID=UPI00051F786E|nr:MFS transporter [Novosphingobium pentaromativorans]AIT82104.1 hypothetical protein JI59_21450 [Novosphingobium pentaromativorans US6-1]